MTQPFPLTLQSKQELRAFFPIGGTKFQEMFNALPPLFPHTFKHYRKESKIITAAQAVAFIIAYQSLPAGYHLDETSVIVQQVRKDFNPPLSTAISRKKSKSAAK